jgi:hypothetical protein
VNLTVGDLYEFVRMVGFCATYHGQNPDWGPCDFNQRVRLRDLKQGYVHARSGGRQQWAPTDMIATYHLWAEPNWGPCDIRVRCRDLKQGSVHAIARWQVAVILHCRTLTMETKAIHDISHNWTFHKMPISIVGT